LFVGLLKAPGVAAVLGLGAAIFHTKGDRHGIVRIVIGHQRELIATRPQVRTKHITSTISKEREGFICLSVLCDDLAALLQLHVHLVDATTIGSKGVNSNLARRRNADIVRSWKIDNIIFGIVNSNGVDVRLAIDFVVSDIQSHVAAINLVAAAIVRIAADRENLIGSNKRYTPKEVQSGAAIHRIRSVLLFLGVIRRAGTIRRQRKLDALDRICINGIGIRHNVDLAIMVFRKIDDIRATIKQAITIAGSQGEGRQCGGSSWFRSVVVVVDDDDDVCVECEFRKFVRTGEDFLIS